MTGHHEEIFLKKIKTKSKWIFLKSWYDDRQERTRSSLYNILIGLITIYFRNQGGEMHGVWDSRWRSIPTKPLSSQATMWHLGKARSYESNKGHEWDNAAYDEKEKSHHFKHPVQDITNYQPHFNQRERIGAWEKWRPIPGVRKREKKEEKLKEWLMCSPKEKCITLEKHISRGKEKRKTEVVLSWKEIA